MSVAPAEPGSASLIAATGASAPGYNKGQIIPTARARTRTNPSITLRSACVPRRVKIDN